jgi:hypothetical protein
MGRPVFIARLAWRRPSYRPSGFHRPRARLLLLQVQLNVLDTFELAQEIRGEAQQQLQVGMRGRELGARKASRLAPRRA